MPALETLVQKDLSLPFQEAFVPVPETRPQTAQLLETFQARNLIGLIDPKAWTLIRVYYSTQSHIKDLARVAGTKNGTDIKVRLLKGVEDIRKAVINDLSQEQDRQAVEQMYPPEAVAAKKVIRRKGPQSEVAVAHITEGIRNYYRNHTRTPEWEQRIKEGRSRYFREHGVSDEWRRHQSEGWFKRFRPEEARRQQIAELYESHRSRIFGFLMTMVRDEIDAEDMTQEVFLRALESFDPKKAPEQNRATWLFKVAKTTALLEFRRRAAMKDSQMDLMGRELLHEQLFGNPFQAREDSWNLREQSLSQIEGAIGQLPKIHQDVVLSVFYQGQTYDQTARSLDIPIGTVSSRINRSIEQLRQQLRVA